METESSDTVHLRPLVKATVQLGIESYSVQAKKGSLLSEQLVSLKEQSMAILKDFITRHNVPQDVPDELLEASSEEDDNILEKPHVMLNLNHTRKAFGSCGAPPLLSLVSVRFHPVERIFFYSFPTTHSHDSSFFFDKIVPNLKTSLSLTLQKFLPLAGNIIWPSHSPKPIIQYNPGDAVSLLIAESNVDFNHVLQNSSCDASESCFLLPNLESSDSVCSVISLQNLVRTTFELSKRDLENFKKRVLSKWDEVDDDDQEEVNSKPHTVSYFVVTCAYVSTCIARAIQEAEKNEQKKFAFGFAVDCRARLEPPIPENYFWNCVNLHLVDAKSDDFAKEDGYVIVAKKIVSKIKNLGKDGVLDGVETLFSKHETRARLGIELIGVAGSSRFGVYETDFGWGRPSKVDITSVDRSLIIGMSESKDGKRWD
ncbi:unnamed protein product [Lupinus luteus]|uniref:Uncharacterized protein n=1 Tax=Lupinus luteus TaxID=3873 RepID=A0AAV1WHA0_LUPLU